MGVDIDLHGNSVVRPSRSERAGWMKRLELRHLWVAIPIVAVFTVSSIQTALEPDLWWHMACGRWMVQTGQFMYTDPFTHTIANQPVVDQNWLAELALFELYRFGGMKLLTLFTALMYTAAVGLMLLCCWKRAPHCRAMAVGGAISALLIYENSAIRPQVFAVLVFSTALFILGHVDWKWKPFLIGLAVLVWTNVHGSFVLGVGLSGIFLTGRILELCFAGRGATDLRLSSGGNAQRVWGALQRDRLVRSYAGCVILAAAAAFCNPQPGLMLSYVRACAANGVRLDVQEWRPTGLASVTGVIFCCTIAMTLMTLNASRKRVTPTDALLLALFLFLGEKAGRLVIWWGLALPPILSVHLATILPNEDPIRERTRQKPLLNLFLAGYLVVAALTPWVKPYTGPATSPGALASFLETSGCTGNLFNPMGWGGYLIWHDPQLKVFADGRLEVFPRKIWQDYDTIADGAPGWEDLLDEYKIDTIVASRNMTPRLAQFPGGSKNWAAIYSDALGVVFERSTKIARP